MKCKNSNLTLSVFVYRRRRESSYNEIFFFPPQISEKNRIIEDFDPMTNNSFWRHEISFNFYTRDSIPSYSSLLIVTLSSFVFYFFDFFLPMSNDRGKCETNIPREYTIVIESLFLGWEGSCQRVDIDRHWTSLGTTYIKYNVATNAISRSLHIDVLYIFNDLSFNQTTEITRGAVNLEMTLSTERSVFICVTLIGISFWDLSVVPEDKWIFLIIDQ